MEEKCQALSDSLNSARPTQLMHAVQRLKEEHKALKEKVTALYSKSMKVRENIDVTIAWSLLQPLRVEVQEMTKELEAHADWGGARSVSDHFRIF